MNNYIQNLDLTLEEIDTLKEAFELYDTTKKGYLEIQQFMSIILDAGIVSNQIPFKQQQKQINYILKSADLNEDSKVDLNEFIMCMYKFIPYKYTTSIPTTAVTTNQNDTLTLAEKNLLDEELLECFYYFDENKDGRISQTELEEVLNHKLNTNLSLFEIKEMMLIADKNKDGYIDFDEFKQLLPTLTL